MTVETTPWPVPAPADPSLDDARFGDVLASAVDLLRTLPRGRHDADAARELVREWAGRGGDPSATLVIDAPPGQSEVGYDLLVEDPEGGTVALSLQTDDGVPWSVDHATHWAAGYVLTIDDDHHLSVPDVLLAVRTAGRHQPALLTQLIDHRLVQIELARTEQEPLSVAEVQAAADGYRRRLGLLSAEATRAWLDQVGLTPSSFEAHLARLAFAARFRRRLAERLGPAHLAAHPEDFPLVHAAWVWCARAETAQQLAAGEPDQLLATASDLAGSGVQLERAELNGSVESLPVALREALPDLRTGVVAGPLPVNGRYLVGAILDRRPMPPGPELDAAAGRAAVEEWLRQRRETADIQWHWL